MPRVTGIERRTVHAAARHNRLATSSTSSTTKLFHLPVVHVAECARVRQLVEVRGMIHVRTRVDVIADKAMGRTTARYNTTPAIPLMRGALERLPVCGLVVAIAGHRYPGSWNEKGGSTREGNRLFEDAISASGCR